MMTILLQASITEWLGANSDCGDETEIAGSGRSIRRLQRSQPRFLERLGRTAINPRRQPLVLLHICRRDLNLCAAATGGIFIAVGRGDMRRIATEIRPPDAKLAAVRIDPFPQDLGGGPSLRAVLALG